MTRHILFCFAIVLLTFTARAYANDDAGACTGSDLNYFYKQNYAFAERMKECSGVFGLDMGCFKETYADMSEGCLDCFSEITSCTISNCVGACIMDGRSEQCSSCSVNTCGAAMQACSGVSSDYWPDFER